MEKSKSIRSKVRSKGLSLEIRYKANILPMKSMVYALSHAKLKLCKSRNSNASLYAQRLTSQARDLSYMIDSLRSSVKPVQLPQPRPPSNPEDPDEHSNAINSAVSTYVDTFYMISKEERKNYIESFNLSKRQKIKAERNLLIIPALMAELNQPKDDVSSTLFCKLYNMPFKVLYESSKSALHIGILEQNMAIKSVPYEVIEKFSKSMSRLETRMKNIDKGAINPQEDEEIKADFIERASDFSKSTEINILDLISERVGTESAILTRMHRLIRRARY